MRITLRQLEVLLAVADHGSTTAAARAVSLSQSATSAALNELEALLGLRLFDRVGRRLVVNERGRALLPDARDAVDVVQGIERRAAASTRARGSADVRIDVRLGASTTIGNYLVPDLVTAFLRRHPSAQVQVRIDNTAAVAAAAARLEVDFALIEGPCHEPALEVQRWRRDELVIVCAAGDPLARRRGTVPLQALRQARWLLREPGSGTREAVEQALIPQLDHLADTLQFDNTEALKQGAAAGLGLTCLSALAVRDLVTLGRLAVLRTAIPAIYRPLYLVHHRRRRFAAEWKPLLG